MRRVLFLLALFPALSFPALSQTAPAGQTVPPTPNSSGLNVRPMDASAPNDNHRVVAMMHMGLDDAIIVAKIKANSWTFQLSDADMLALRKNGVSARVVAAMVDDSVTAVAKVTVDDQPVTIVTMGQAKSAGRFLNNITGDLTSVKENAFLEGGTATTEASPMPEILVTLPRGDSIGNYILVKIDRKDDTRRELSVGTGGGIGSGRTGLSSNSPIRPIRVILRSENVYQLLPLNELKAGQYMVYVVGSSDEQKDIYGKGYDFAVNR